MLFTGVATIPATHRGIQVPVTACMSLKYNRTDVTVEII
jgi:hypothetical protein